jgi:hypothetical protein
MKLEWCVECEERFANEKIGGKFKQIKFLENFLLTADLLFDSAGRISFYEFDCCYFSVV